MTSDQNPQLEGYVRLIRNNQTLLTLEQMEERRLYEQIEFERELRSIVYERFFEYRR